MTTPILALERLFGAVASRFAAEAGVVSLPEVSRFSGSASIAGVPTEASETRVEFTVGGTVGVAGIVYRVSTDDGATFGPTVALGTSSTIVVRGVTLTISGTVVADDFVRWTQTGPEVPAIVFGTREPAKRGDVYRIVFVPGDDAGFAGDYSPARNPGRNPRPLGTLRERFTVYVEAFDATAAESELAQWKACRLLWDALVRAIHLEAHGTFFVLSTSHMVDRSTRRHAWSMRSVVEIESMVPDAPAFVPTVPLDAELTEGLETDSDEPEVISP